ncbi:MAG: CopG family transcriptional regulator [Hyphomicrobiaceae bacterium]|nr:CopG family transcriptional regulator [Hyphomicrobiaceae bacterium]
MRTTLDIDDDVLQMAKELARAEKKTAGAVISDLARKALTRAPGQRRIVVKDGFPLLESTGAVVTPELIERLLEEADFEDARIQVKSDAGAS